MPATEWAGDSGILHLGHQWEGVGESGMWARACPRDVRREAVTFLCAGQEGELRRWPGVMDGVGECMGREQ